MPPDAPQTATQAAPHVSATSLPTRPERCRPSARPLFSDPLATPWGWQRSSELHAYVVSLRRWAGELGMGRTGSSLDNRFPPQGGGRSPRRVNPFVGRKTERPLCKVVVVVVVEGYLFLINIIVGAPQPWPLRFVETVCTLLSNMCTPPSQNDHPPNLCVLL